MIRKKYKDPKLQEKIRVENEAAMAYADSIRKKPKGGAGKMNYGSNKKLSLGIAGCYFL